MADHRFDIGSYTEYRGEQSPRVFFAHGEKITVLQFLKMWIEHGEQNEKRRRFYKVEGSDGLIHSLYYDFEADAWFYRSFEPGRNKQNQVREQNV